MSAQPQDFLGARAGDRDPQETQEWLDALKAVIGTEGDERAHFILEALIDEARQAGGRIGVIGGHLIEPPVHQAHGDAGSQVDQIELQFLWRVRQRAGGDQSVQQIALAHTGGAGEERVLGTHGANFVVYGQ